MFPSLIDLGRRELPLFGEVHLALPTYGVLFALGALGGGWWFIRRGRTLGVPDDRLYDLCFYSMLAGILGAKLTLLVVEWRYYLANPSALLGIVRSAGVLLGGVIAGALTFLWYARRHGLDWARLADATAAPLALAQAVGRLGCFSAGCCWGVPLTADNPLAVTFHDPVAHARTGVPLGQPLLAVQLIQFAHDLTLAFVLTWLWRRRSAPAGSVFWWYVLLYSVGRIVIEFWRGDAQRGLWFDGLFSTSQLISLGGVAVGLLMLLRGRLGERVPVP